MALYFLERSAYYKQDDRRFASLTFEDHFRNYDYDYEVYKHWREAGHFCLWRVDEHFFVGNCKVWLAQPVEMFKVCSSSTTS